MSNTTFQPNTEGVFYDLPAAVYHAAPGVSQSLLKEFDEAASPLHFKALPKKKPTKDMEFGTICHTAILEPKDLEASYYVQPDTYPAENKKTKEIEHKKWNGNADFCGNWKESHTDKPVLDKYDVAKIPCIVSRVMRLELFKDALSVGEREVSFFKRDEATGLLLKARTDLIVVEKTTRAKWIFDLKKVQSGGASETEFQTQVANFGYHIQNASYASITGAEGFVFVAFDDDQPGNGG